MTHEEAARFLSVHSSTCGSGQCTDEQHEEAKRIAIKVLEDNRWIPIEEKLSPEEEHILISFENYSLPVVGSMYKGAFYYGDNFERSLESFGLIINAWKPVPRSYREKAN